MIDLTPVRAELPAIFEHFAELRRFFPALHVKLDGRLPIFFDGPGGTQVPQSVIDQMVWYLTTCNATTAESSPPAGSPIGLCPRRRSPSLT